MEIFTHPVTLLFGLGVLVLSISFLYVADPAMFYRWYKDLFNPGDKDYQQRRKLLAWAEGELEKINEDELDSVTDKLSSDEDESVLEEVEKVKVLRASTEDELNQLWKKFKSRKAKNYYYLDGEITSIQKKKIKVVGSELQIKVFYWEAVIIPGKEKEYQDAINLLPRIALHKQLEDLVDDLEDFDEPLESVIRKYPMFQSVMQTV